MPERKILQMGDPTLWEKSQPIDDLSSSETASLIRDLSDTLAAFREAMGRIVLSDDLPF